MQQKKIHYEPHPVSVERKRELMAQGFKIVDAKFAPPEWKAAQVEEPPKRGRKPKEETPALEPEVNAE